MKRVFDILLAIFLCFPLAPLFLIISLLVKLTSQGPALHRSKRVGRNGVIFLMPKFRSMFINTPNVATHLLKDSSSHITKLGSFLRKTSLDEIPQLASVIKGEMSFVGPRPALFNQYDLISMRDQLKINNLRPGITGWAQINGRDEISIEEKIKLDAHYLKHQNIWLDIRIIVLTISKVFLSSNVKH